MSAGLVASGKCMIENCQQAIGHACMHSTPPSGSSRTRQISSIQLSTIIIIIQLCALLRCLHSVYSKKAAAAIKEMMHKSAPLN